MGLRSTLAPALLAAALATSAGAQPFEPDVTNSEFGCMRRVADEAQDFVKKRLACVIRCTKNFWRGAVPESECVPPYAGKTLECITRYRGPEQRLTDTIDGCSSSCPECWDPSGDCSISGAAATRPGELADFVDQYVGALFCEFAVATRPEQTCQRKTTKELAKMVANVGECADTCALGARHGAFPYSECTQPSDSVIAACIAPENARRVARIDKACAEAVADPTFCEGGYPSGATWDELVRAGFVSYFALDDFCGS